MAGVLGAAQHAMSGNSDSGGSSSNETGQRQVAGRAELPPEVDSRIQQAAGEVDSALSDPALSPYPRRSTKAQRQPEETRSRKPSGKHYRSNEQRTANEEFLKAAEDAATAPPSEQATAHDALKQAGERLNRANENVLNNVEDTDASSMSGNKSSIDQGRAALQKAGAAQKSMVDDVVKMLKPKQ